METIGKIVLGVLLISFVGTGLIVMFAKANDCKIR